MFTRSAAWRISLWFVLLTAATARAQQLQNDQLKVQIGTNGELSSLQIVHDAFPTNYVLNASNAPGQNTADHAWVGELMLSYRHDGGAWQPALTQKSADVRKITQDGGAVVVTYQGSQTNGGIRDFKVVERYALEADALRFSIELTNTGSTRLEIGDLGLPLPFNELWTARDVIYETRTVYHSFTGQNSSYITIGRPSGVGPLLLLTPDASTGAGFEYMDSWRAEEHADSAWVAGGGTPRWQNGLTVFYVHSQNISATHRGYLPNTSLMLEPGQSKTYAFKFAPVASRDAVKQRLYDEGLVDVTVVPGMIFATDMTARFDLHTKKPIASVTAQYPNETTIQPLSAADGHNLYALTLQHLGQNDLYVSYGDGERTTLQFYALEPIEAALNRHATFMVKSTVSQDPKDPLYRVFDDWMMDQKARRGVTGSWGWGDDWGWTHGQFLAEKNALTPVAAEVQALDDYLATVWGTQIDSRTGAVSDWFCVASSPANCHYDRAFAYPHVFNTYFSMYKIARLYPKLITYKLPADTYLMRAYQVLRTLYSGPGDPGTGYMGEQTLPDIITALKDENHATEAKFVSDVVGKLYAAFKSSAYPYGSEYSYDNTGEEAVYMAAKLNGDAKVLEKVNTKTRACRGQQPIWYYYADPVTLNGENWWQFQYSVSLIGYCMDDWLRSHSMQPELDERLSYAAKLANVSAINSGQIDAAPENLGTVAWTYQAMKGDVYMGQPDSGRLHNGWRNMSGEADLGLFGAVRILSSDVAQDPLFGLYCYGCEVAQGGSCYTVQPKDGIFKRLNLITERVYLSLERDRYTQATLGTGKTYVALDLQNQTGDAHSTKLSVTGLAAGAYPVSVDGKSGSMLMVSGNAAASVLLEIGPEPTHKVQIGSDPGCVAVTPGGAPTAPTAAMGGRPAGTPTGPGVGPVAGSGAATARPAAGTSAVTAGAMAIQSGAAGTATAPGSPTTAPGTAAPTTSGCSCQLLAKRPAPLSTLAGLAIGSTLLLSRIGRRNRARRSS